MKNLLKRLVVEEQGQDVIEYALLAAGISIAVIPTVPGMRHGCSIRRLTCASTPPWAPI